MTWEGWKIVELEGDLEGKERGDLKFVLCFCGFSEWSDKFEFKTAPMPGSEDAESVKFVAYGDMGYFDSGKRVAELIEDEELDDIDFIMHVG